MKKIRSLFYLIAQGFIGVFRNSFMSVASVLVLVCCMLIVGTFGLLIGVFELNVQSIDSLNMIVAYVDSDFTTEETEDTVIEEIRTKIENVKNVTEVVYISKEEARDRVIANLGDDQIIGDYNPLPAAFEIKFQEVDQAHIIINNIGNIEGISHTKDKISIIETADSIKTGIFIVASILMAILLIVSLFVIMNTIKLGVFARRQEISIMRYIGATNSFITMPFIVEGLIIGMFSALISFGIQYYVYTHVLANIILEHEIGIVPAFSHYSMEIALVFIAVGLFAGIIASSASVKKYLKA
ncbi:permease-like cell division protein FtsX [Eubacteriales bacterium OttesenSCG-928-G02]|nr:permease-like cell division protein FtsX [Eubacteriales bacterium OttesenSCG-928-G02]